MLDWAPGGGGEDQQKKYSFPPPPPPDPSLDSPMCIQTVSSLDTPMCIQRSIKSYYGSPYSETNTTTHMLGQTTHETETVEKTGASTA